MMDEGVKNCPSRSNMRKKKFKILIIDFKFRQGDIVDVWNATIRSFTLKFNGGKFSSNKSMVSGRM